ncbi:Six-hairpin glycosidase-like protein [Gongronella butleri]|nr:Six-hairpin glycosidase-like protein [Gongronella butleri]
MTAAGDQWALGNAHPPFTYFSVAIDDQWLRDQPHISMKYLLRNINPPGTRRGFIAASPSTSYPDYFYSWVRDASLVTYALISTQWGQRDAVVDDAMLRRVVRDFVDFQVHTQSTIADAPCQCYGEPKYMANGDAFVGPWGRPQNDGPAERVIALILLANHVQAQNDTQSPFTGDDGMDDAFVDTVLQPAIYQDLDYIVDHWLEPSFDLWEEVKGQHFFTWMAMRRGLLDGATFAQKRDFERSHRYRRVARRIEAKLASFWSERDGYVRVTQNRVQGHPKPAGLDVAVLLAANLADPLQDGFFTSSSDKMLATAVALETRFAALYPLNLHRNASAHGVALGRYVEDVYDGYGTSQGNPWFLATAALAELYYRALRAWHLAGGVEVNLHNHGFFWQRDTTVVTGHVYVRGRNDYRDLQRNLLHDADKLLATIQYHQQQNGALSEQFSRYTGFQQGAPDLTWSYASLLSALHARNELMDLIQPLAQ